MPRKRVKMSEKKKKTYRKFSTLTWTDLGSTLTALLILMPGLATPFLDEERKPSYLRAAVGESVAFNCHIDFPHDVSIPYILNWKKEGQTIFSSYETTRTAKGFYHGRIKVLSNDPRFGKASINITNIRETDGGWYECDIIYPNRSPSRHQNGTWFHLKVDGGNVIVIPPINQTTIEGELARFPCSTKENSSTVIWKKDKVRLSNRNHNFPVRYTLDLEGTLTISPTEMDDTGEFTCEATNSKGEKQSASAFLNVQYKAKVIHSPKEVYLPYGRSAVIDCHFRANPPLMKLRWEKDGFLFDPYNVQGVVYRSNGSLFFEKVKEEHEGVYTCTPYNELGTEGPSPKMNVVVQKPPVFTVIPHMLYIRKKGDTIQIPCDATEDHGIHKPNIVWMKNGKPVPEEKFKPSGGNLTLSRVQEEDRGIYQCVASNAVTSIFTETELMIENTAPRAPYNVRVESTEDSITVTWKSGLTKPKLEFSVWYRIVDSMVWKFLPAVQSEANEVKIMNLLSGTDYEVMVLSQDVYGDGMFSKSVKIKTKGEADFEALERQLRENYRNVPKKMPEPPRNLNVYLTPEGLMITWDPPEKATEKMEHYTIEWKKNGEVLRAFTKENFLLITDYAKEETYRFQVFAESEENSRSEGATLVMYFPFEQKSKALTLGVSLGCVLLIIAILLSWFIHKHYSRKVCFGTFIDDFRRHHFSVFVGPESIEIN